MIKPCNEPGGYQLDIFLLAGYMFPELPLIIEGGILLDLIGIVMISGIVMRLREDTVSDVIEEFEEFKG